MPEGPEVETEKLHEAIHEELEREGGAFLRNVALTTALLAALAAIASLQAGASVNEALILKAESTRLQAAASDQWAYYQAKGIKAAVQQAEASTWKALGKTPGPEFEAAAQKYAGEQAEIKAEAEKLEKERDEKSHEADELMHRHHAFANAVALVQVAIALGAVAALTRQQLVWLGSVLLGAGGLVMFLWTLFR
jgi:glucan-binding YG repeat protein